MLTIKPLLKHVYFNVNKHTLQIQTLLKTVPYAGSTVLDILDRNDTTAPISISQSLDLLVVELLPLCANSFGCCNKRKLFALLSTATIACL